MVVMHHVMVVMHDVVPMVVHRVGQGGAGRQGERGGRGQREGDEFQSFLPSFADPRIGIRTQAAKAVQPIAQDGSNPAGNLGLTGYGLASGGKRDMT